MLHVSQMFLIKLILKPKSVCEVYEFNGNHGIGL